MAAPFPNLKEHEILSLRQKIEKEMAHEQSEKPQIISFKNQQFVVKFARQEKKRDRQEKLSAAAYFLLFRKWLSPRCFEALTVKQEAKRIINLNALNLQVAPIYYYNEQYFIQAYSGVSLDTVLPRTKKTQ